MLNSPKLRELKAKRRSVFTQKFLLFIFGFVLTCIALTYLLSIKQISISSVEVIGNKVIDTEDIQKVTEETISGKYLWFFPRKNVFLYPKDKVVNNLKEKFKRFDEVNVEIKDRNILAIQVAERSPRHVWCGSELPVNQDIQKCYFLDTEGYIFDEAPYFSGQVYFKFYGSVPGEAPSGQYFNRDYFAKLIVFKDRIESFDFNPVALYVDNAGDAIMVLSRGKNATEDPQILFKVSDDLEKIAENLKAARDAEPLASKLKEFYSSLSYIDLRFENKVYYKFK